jgi:hypothetical protein
MDSLEENLAYSKGVVPNLETTPFQVPVSEFQRMAH